MKATSSDTIESEPTGRFSSIPPISPVHFAIVMGTGIVSLAANLQGWHVIAIMLFWLNVIIYAVLWLLLVVRLTMQRSERGRTLLVGAIDPGIFAVVAATGVLGSQIVALIGSLAAALPFWLLSAALWLLCTYSFFVAIIVPVTKLPATARVNGLWLLPVVATQAVSFLGTRVVSLFGSGEHAMFLVTLALWLAGCVLYLLLIGVIFYRLVVLPVTAAELTAPYWISMGALAISALAGAELGVSAPQWSVLETLLPFLHGLSLSLWAAATWWIPLLLALGVWRHSGYRHRLHYHLEYWGIVFPLGMYCAATYDLAVATGIGDLFIIPRFLTYLALAVWAVVFGGLLAELVVVFRGMRKQTR